MLVREAKGFLSKLVLAGQRCAKQRGIIRVQSDHDPLIEIILHWMFSRRLANSRAQIAGKADFHRDLAVSEFFNQIGILRGAESVADALGVKIQRSPYGLGWTGLPGMSGQGQAMGFGGSAQA